MNVNISSGNQNINLKIDDKKKNLKIISKNDIDLKYDDDNNN